MYRDLMAAAYVFIFNSIFLLVVLNSIEISFGITEYTVWLIVAIVIIMSDASLVL